MIIPSLARSTLLKASLLIFLIALIICPTFVSAAELEGLSFTGEVSGGATRLGNEAIDLVKTPFQTENGNILLTLGVVGAVGLTYALDRNIQSKIQTTKGSGLNKAADAGSLVGDPYIHLGLSALVYGTAIAADSAKWKETGEMMGEAVILADASTFLIKESVGRGRPNVSVSKGEFKPFRFKNNYDSFPSMHTSSSFALASVLAATSESLVMKTAYYTAATFVAFSRLYKNKHWASDVVFGAALGELCGRVVTSYHASRAKIAVIPQTYGDGAGLALVGRW